VNWSDIAGAVGKAAPILGTALGGPLGGVAGALIASALGTSNDADSVNTALAADPAALEKLKEAEMANKVQMQQLVITAEANRLADVQNARARQTANPKDYTPQFLAGGVTLGFFGALAAVMLAPMSNAVHDLLLVMIGALQTAWVTIVSYYFGSSKESAGQTKMIADVGYAAASAPINIHSAAQQAPTVGPSTLPEPSLFKGH
jgi:hypothetical protein